jgi:hypothetical protein
VPDDTVLADGHYDALVVDASRDGATVHVELTIIAGAHKGEIVRLAATGMERDELDLLGVPATITVTSGRPAVTFDG